MRREERVPAGGAIASVKAVRKMVGVSIRRPSANCQNSYAATQLHNNNTVTDSHVREAPVRSADKEGAVPVSRTLLDLQDAKGTAHTIAIQLYNNNSS